MIALDSSAIVAFVLDEPDSELFGRIILTDDCVLGAPTLFESEMVIRSKANAGQLRKLNELLTVKNIAVCDFTRGHADAAFAAFDRYGRGSGHAARLNFGDCMAYAVARVASVPLLFKGNDFTHTDIVPAWAP